MLTVSDVAKHSNRESCWVIIEGRVYDVTDFLEEHPGGPEIILRYAGKVFHGLLDSYYILQSTTNNSQDATEEYLPVHPPGTIENELSRGETRLAS